METSKNIPNFSVEMIHLGVEPKIGGKPPKWMAKIMDKPY